MKSSIRILVLVVIVAAAVAYYLSVTRHRAITLTGVVTTDEVIVASEIQGRIEKLLAKQGDKVTNGQLLAVIQPQELKAALDFYTKSVQQSGAQVAQAEADLQYQELQSSNLIAQSEANLSAAKDQVAQAQADAENVQLTYKRQQELNKQGVNSPSEFDAARTSLDAAKARVASLQSQVTAAEAAVGLAKSSRGQITARRAALDASRQQQAAMSAQSDRAQVQLDYTQIRAPISGFVDVRAALQGEVVTPGQGIITLIDPNDLWIRVDVEETYIDSIHGGDKMQIKLPSGAEKTGTVYFRGKDADYATQRDVSRSKRDIKTFEIRLRFDNADGAMAVGMTAYVALNPPSPK